MTTQAFTSDTYNRVKEAIINVDQNKLSDIYVISFYKSNFNDDPRHPMLTVGYNTISQWKTSSPSDGEELKSFIASDADEAKWNYAFWLQNEELVIGSPE